jgi:hypothetical protein
MPDHEGTRTIVLRFLKTITPVQCVTPRYDGFMRQPMEGELYQKAGKFWSINIDKRVLMLSPGLQIIDSTLL